jgi:hypothetical protein
MRFVHRGGTPVHCAGEAAARAAVPGAATVRSERQSDRKRYYNLLFRLFVGPTVDPKPVLFD